MLWELVQVSRQIFNVHLEYLSVYIHDPNEKDDHYKTGGNSFLRMNAATLVWQNCAVDSSSVVLQCT